ncbi:DUF6489 family protein [Gallaecimonas mangrovi]|uniref:DUF6489 family protein n=1 Tax=Gallaecimonas mangrovi TaxID=2291597 RepID=UPI000E2015CC|nr:DUF6489 family protein [Gallaecimonas mangrovi]
MKVTIDIECTPEEARSFLGLPDIKPMQAKMMADFEQQMQKGLSSMDPETLAKTWFGTSNIKAVEELQKAFWLQMMGKAGQGS